MSKDTTANNTNANDGIDIIQFWKLPDNFYDLSIDEQWAAIKSVTINATPLSSPRLPCSLSLYDEMISLLFFVITLGIPATLIVLWSYVMIAYRTMDTSVAFLGIITLFLSLHPFPSGFSTRHNRVALALIRYFSIEGMFDRNNDDLGKHACTPFVDSDEYQKGHLPGVYLACPHGVFNFGAMSWCTFSRWVCGWNQYTPAANVVKYVPGLRYMDGLIWIINADAKSIVNVLQHKTQRGGRTGGMIGMNPDGILGAFRTESGVDVLMIGRRRGLMRLCAQNSATVVAAWFFGTNEMLVPLKDPWGIMEYISRKAQVGMMGFYGRWYLPIPRRVACTFVVATHRCELNKQPTAEDLDSVHDAVYGNLQKAYDKHKVYAGYPERTLKIM